MSVHHVCIPTLISLARELARAYDAADMQDRDPRDSGSRKRTQLARPDRMARFGHTIGGACSHPKLPLDFLKINQWIPVDWVWRAIMSFGQNQKQGILSHLLSFTINQPLCSMGGTHFFEHYASRILGAPDWHQNPTEVVPNHLSWARRRDCTRRWSGDLTKCLESSCLPHVSHGCLEISWVLFSYSPPGSTILQPGWSSKYQASDARICAVWIEWWKAGSHLACLFGTSSHYMSLPACRNKNNKLGILPEGSWKLQSKQAIHFSRIFDAPVVKLHDPLGRSSLFNTTRLES